jgi:diguanylate cyclase (GGDEF)-like protein
LQVRLEVGRRILRWQEELIAAREALRVQAMRDALTGLWNRGASLDLLGCEMNRVRRDGRPTGILLIDLDHFKAINDTHGHLAGDAVLREAARRMRAVIRPYDLLGRYGGEEFLGVFPGCDLPGVLNQCERLRRSLADEPVVFDSTPIQVTASFGVTIATPESAQDFTALLHSADTALYRAKHRGRNRVEAATDFCHQEEG